MSNPSTRQAEHYSRIHDDYAAHYYDSDSLTYRERFVLDLWFDGLDLNGKIVADLACGSGYNSLSLLARYPDARPLGLDISTKACEDYRREVGAEARVLDLTAGDPAGIQADAAMVFGGLHHCVSDLHGTFRTIAGLLKPGGLLLMYEPNAGFFLEWVRRLWYRFDDYFDAQTEHALDHDRILDIASDTFEPIDCVYGGGPAYFLILNSLVFRIPLRLKHLTAKTLFAIEHLYGAMPGRAPFPVFVARWRRRIPNAPTGEVRRPGG